MDKKWGYKTGSEETNVFNFFNFLNFFNFPI